MRHDTKAPRLILASASPARLATLRRAGVDPEVRVSGVAEDEVGETSADQYALRLAHRKARAVAGQFGVGSVLVLGCDSVLEFDGEIHGKPDDPAVAIQRWQRMRGRSGVLHTGHCVIDCSTGKLADGAAATTVRFADLSDTEIEEYVATGEPLAVAGGFTIDGFGGPFVEAIDGDHHNVVGVSLPLVRRLLVSLGVSWPSLWATDGDQPDTPRPQL